MNLLYSMILKDVGEYAHINLTIKNESIRGICTDIVCTYTHTQIHYISFYFFLGRRKKKFRTIMTCEVFDLKKSILFTRPRSNNFSYKWVPYDSSIN